MTYDIIKTKTKPEYVFDATTAKAVIIEGLRTGNIKNIHDAVTLTGAKNGDYVSSLLEQLVQELKNFSAQADDTLIIPSKSANGNFRGTDLQAFKTEQFGSIAEWKAKIKASRSEYDNNSM